MWNATSFPAFQRDAKQPAQPPVGEHAHDEVLAQPRVAEAPLLLDRQVREPLEQGLGEEAPARRGRRRRRPRRP